LIAPNLCHARIADLEIPNGEQTAVTPMKLQPPKIKIAGSQRGSWRMISTIYLIFKEVPSCKIDGASEMASGFANTTSEPAIC
jgi:hypothetical protein